MFFDPEVYKPEVKLCGDGFYRWMYTLDQYHDRQMYRLLRKIWAVIAIGGLVLGFLLADGQWPVPVSLIREDYSRYKMLQMTHRIIFALAGYAAFFAFGLLLSAFIRLIDHGPATYWYRANEDIVHIEPSGKGSGIVFLENVSRIELYREVNEIRLFSPGGKTPVLVRAEDYETILQLILSHVPGSAAVEERSVQRK